MKVFVLRNFRGIFFLSIALHMNMVRFEIYFSAFVCTTLNSLSLGRLLFSYQIWKTIVRKMSRGKRGRTLILQRI